MRILITGSKGFIGSEIRRQTEALGHHVSGWDLPEKDVRDRALADFDLSARHASYDLVIHLAAITSQTEFDRDPRSSFDTNVNGLLNVLEACRKSKVPRVVFASSSAIYGPLNGYAASKLMGETLFNSYVHKGCFQGPVLRFFNTYGPNEESKGNAKSIISQFLETIATRKEVVVYGNGEQRRDFIHVRDVARMTLELSNRIGTFDVGTGRAVSWNEIIGMLRAYGLKFKVRYVENPLSDYQLLSRALRPPLEAEISIEDGVLDLLKRREGFATVANPIV